MEYEFDELIGKYIDKDGNIVNGIAEVDVDSGEVMGFIGEDSFLEEQKKQAVMIEKTLTNLKQQMSVLENRKKEISANILNEMKRHDIWKIDIGDVTITRVKATERHLIDSKKLKAEMPEIAQMYETVTPVAESIRINLGGTKNEF